MIDSMDTSQESQAPSTESSYQQLPIPQSHTHPLPFRVTNTSVKSRTTNKDIRHQTADGRRQSAVGRQIFKPVGPSIRTITERPTPSCSNKIITRNAFLPKELAEIVAIRQRRERAWHARLMICTNCPLNQFTSDVENSSYATRSDCRSL
ncbi:hypothetical protein EPUL_006828, partial [Erysiphe pulchra]